MGNKTSTTDFVRRLGLRWPVTRTAPDALLLPEVRTLYEMELDTLLSTFCHLSNDELRSSTDLQKAIAALLTRYGPRIWRQTIRKDDRRPWLFDTDDARTNGLYNRQLMWNNTDDAQLIRENFYQIAIQKAMRRRNDAQNRSARLSSVTSSASDATYIDSETRPEAQASLHTHATSTLRCLGSLSKASILEGDIMKHNDAMSFKRLSIWLGDLTDHDVAVNGPCFSDLYKSHFHKHNSATCVLEHGLPTQGHSRRSQDSLVSCEACMTAGQKCDKMQLRRIYLTDGPGNSDEYVNILRIGTNSRDLYAIAKKVRVPQTGSKGLWALRKLDGGFATDVLFANAKEISVPLSTAPQDNSVNSVDESSLESSGVAPAPGMETRSGRLRHTIQAKPLEPIDQRHQLECVGVCRDHRIDHQDASNLRRLGVWLGSFESDKRHMTISPWPSYWEVRRDYFRRTNGGTQDDSEPGPVPLKGHNAESDRLVICAGCPASADADHLRIQQINFFFEEYSTRRGDYQVMRRKIWAFRSKLDGQEVFALLKSVSGKGLWSFWKHEGGHTTDTFLRTIPADTASPKLSRRSVGRITSRLAVAEDEPSMSGSVTRSRNGLLVAVDYSALLESEEIPVPDTTPAPQAPRALELSCFGTGGTTSASHIDASRLQQLGIWLGDYDELKAQVSGPSWDSIQEQWRRRTNGAAHDDSEKGLHTNSYKSINEADKSVKCAACARHEQGNGGTMQLQVVEFSDDGLERAPGTQNFKRTVWVFPCELNGRAVFAITKYARRRLGKRALWSFWKTDCGYTQDVMLVGTSKQSTTQSECEEAQTVAKPCHKRQRSGADPDELHLSVRQRIDNHSGDDVPGNPAANDDDSDSLYRLTPQRRSKNNARDGRGGFSQQFARAATPRAASVTASMARDSDYQPSVTPARSDSNSFVTTDVAPAGGASDSFVTPDHATEREASESFVKPDAANFRIRLWLKLQNAVGRTAVGLTSGMSVQEAFAAVEHTLTRRLGGQTVEAVTITATHGQDLADDHIMIVEKDGSEAWEAFVEELADGTNARAEASAIVET